MNPVNFRLLILALLLSTTTNAVLIAKNAYDSSSQVSVKPVVDGKGHQTALKIIGSISNPGTQGLEPQTPEAKSAKEYYSLCTTQLESGDKQGALASCNQALRLDSRYADAYLLRGKVMEQLGNKEDATSDYLQAIKIAMKN